VGVTAGSREVPGREPAIRDNNDDDVDSDATDRTVPNNKTDIIIRDNKNEHVCYICCKSWKHIFKREAEKILKYKDIITEIQRMWNVKAKVIPVIVGVTGININALRQYLNNIPGKHEIKELR
jgi:hypothetical protein